MLVAWSIVPLYFSSQVTTPAPGVKPYTALQLEGRDVFIREGCYNCHSQIVRPLRAETERYGHYSLAGERGSMTTLSILDRTQPIWPAWAANTVR